MRITHVATIKQTYKWVPDAFGGDSLTLLAAGDVIAGFDFSKLSEDDVTRDASGGVILHLPAPEILVTRHRQSGDPRASTATPACCGGRIPTWSRAPAPTSRR